MLSLPLHPMLAPLVQGGAVPGRWLAEVRGAGEWSERFVNEGWDSLEALRGVSYAALLESPLGESYGALAAALGHFEDGTNEASEAEAESLPVRNFGGPVERTEHSHERSPRAIDRVASGGRAPPLPPASPRGPISPEFAATRLAQRAMSAGLDVALRQVLGPQAVGRSDAPSASESQAPPSGWNQVVGDPRQQHEVGRRGLAGAGVGVSAQSKLDSSRSMTTRDETARWAEAVERALCSATPARRSLDGRKREQVASVAAAEVSSPASAALGRPRQGSAKGAESESAARGGSPAVPTAEGRAARTAAAGLTGLRGLAARAAAAEFGEPIDGFRRATVEGAADWRKPGLDSSGVPRRATVEGATEPPSQPPQDEPRSRSERTAPPASLDDEQLAAQLARVLRREAERDGVDIDDVLP